MRESSVFVSCPRGDLYEQPRRVYLYGAYDAELSGMRWYCSGCAHMTGAAACGQCLKTLSILATSQPDFFLRPQPFAGPWLSKDCAE